MQKRAAIYVRVSTDKQTIDNQVAALRQIAERRGWEVVEQYHDAGISGARGRDGRPCLDQMLNDAQRRKFDVIMAWAIDRLGRTRLRPVMSWLTSRMARMALSRVRSRMIAPASIIRSTRSVEPTLSSVVVSLMLESPTITCRRRNRSASACGSSLVLMIGRDLVVAEDTLSQMCSARWLTQ